MASLSPGALANPQFFNYGVEAYEAHKKRSLSSDIADEQKKVQEADLVIFQVCCSSDYRDKFGSLCAHTLPKYRASCSQQRCWCQRTCTLMSGGAELWGHRHSKP